MLRLVYLIYVPIRSIIDRVIGLESADDEISVAPEEIYR